VIDVKVVVGISGGVDSSVSALLLKEEGHDVLGITMKLFESNKTDEMIENAKKVCEEIGIKHFVLDLVNEFREIVINDFIENYKNGKTPNPCVLCNKYFKFGLLYEKAKELGYDYIATGHYVNTENNKLKICDNNKDQSYFLYGINKDILDKIIFPLKKFKNKEEIREIARINNLSVSENKDSQEICFIPNDDYIKYLENYLEPSKGKIIDLNGNILGKHDGLYKYTIGQRKGLGIASKWPLYVCDIDVVNNQIIVCKNEELYKDKLIAKNVNLLVKELPTTCMAKIRSRGVMAECEVIYKDNKLFVTFNEKQRAITKGQSIVLYKDNVCLGGGIIDEIL